MGELNLCGGTAGPSDRTVREVGHCEGTGKTDGTVHLCDRRERGIVMGLWGILKGQWHIIKIQLDMVMTLGRCNRTGAHCDSVMDNYTINVTGQPCDGPMENRQQSFVAEYCCIIVG